MSTNTTTTQNSPLQTTSPTATVTTTLSIMPTITVKNTPTATPSNTGISTTLYPTETTDASGCPPGEYRVSGYYRKDGTYVSSYCRHYPNEG